MISHSIYVCKILYTHTKIKIILSNLKFQAQIQRIEGEKVSVFILRTISICALVCVLINICILMASWRDLTSGWRRSELRAPSCLEFSDQAFIESVLKWQNGLKSFFLKEGVIQCLLLIAVSQSRSGWIMTQSQCSSIVNTKNKPSALTSINRQDLRVKLLTQQGIPDGRVKSAA